MADKTVTVKSSGGDYTTLADALSTEAADLTSASYYLGGPGKLIIECYNFEDTQGVNETSATWVTSTDYYVHIKAVDDHGGKWSTSAYRLHVTGNSANILTINQTDLEHIHIQGLQIHTESTSALSPAIKSTGAPTTGFMWVEDCIIIADDTASGGALRGIRLEEANLTYLIWNTIIYGTGGDAGSQGLQTSSTSCDVWAYYLTIDDIATGFQEAGGTIRAKNCRVTNVTTVAANSLEATSNYNLTDNATAPTNWGANSIDGGDTPTIDYVDDTNATATSRDYHINSTSDSGYQAGVSLSSDGDNPVSTDIDGDTRHASTPTIGADEYIVAGGATAGSAPRITIQQAFAAIQRAATW